MMLKPAIDILLDRINSKYSLVILASKRAHELEEGHKPMIEEFQSFKSVGRALEEIEQGLVVVHPHPEMKRERIKKEIELKKQVERREHDRIQKQIENENGPLL